MKVEVKKIHFFKKNINNSSLSWKFRNIKKKVFLQNTSMRKFIVKKICKFKLCKTRILSGTSDTAINIMQ